MFRYRDWQLVMTWPAICAFQGSFPADTLASWYAPPMRHYVRCVSGPARIGSQRHNATRDIGGRLRDAEVRHPREGVAPVPLRHAILLQHRLRAQQPGVTATATQASPASSVASARVIRATDAFTRS
jgi:hypothetical protein